MADLFRPAVDAAATAAASSSRRSRSRRTPVPQPGAPAPTGQPAPRPRSRRPARPRPCRAVVPGQTMTREAALKASPRLGIETPRVAGSINLKGGRIDDLQLTHYRETVNPKSPPVVLLAPSGAPMPFYAEFGWVAAAGNTMPLPNSDTVWKQQGAGTLGVGRPVTLVHDNGQGLEFRRTISVDDKYMFTVRDEVVNKGAEPATLYPYALISRHGHPQLEGFYILHEGLIGVFGEQGLKEVGYADIEKQKQIPFKATNAWLGITDKYWAATLVPDTDAAIQARVLERPERHHQDLSDPLSARPGDHRAGRDRRRQCAAVRRRQGGRDRRRLRPAIQAQPLRAADRLGLLPLHHQAAVPGDGLALPLLRQFRRRHPVDHRHHQDLLLPARQQVLRLDGEDEGGAAGDAGDPRPLRRRQGQAAAGDDGALQEGEDQSDRGLPADPDPDPGVLRALQGAVHHHRDAPRAVLRLDQGPLGAGPDHDLQPVRAHSLGPAARRSARPSARS